MDSDKNAHATGDADSRSRWSERSNRLKSLVPTLAVVVVVVTALAATVMVTHSDWQAANRPPAVAKGGHDVVRAPPLVVAAPPQAPASAQERPPLIYTPAHLAEKILTTRHALEDERKAENDGEFSV